MRLAGKRIVLGVTGSIAAYKSVSLLRLLQKEGAEIQVVLTQAAAHFVAPLTFSTLSRKPVLQDLWDTQADWTQHVHLGKWADLILVAPATAHTLAKMAHGLTDDALTATVLAADCPVALAPAMDREMYAHAQTQANLARLLQLGYTVWEAPSGYLASGLEGGGRMQEPETLLEEVVHLLGPQLFAGKRLLITAGPTQEAIDPVRYLSNHSTGQMGYALAEAAQRMGATVTLVTGPTQLAPPQGVQVVPIVSAQDLFDAVHARWEAQDAFILAAAVADYTPQVAAPQKIKKQEEEMHLVLRKTPDTLAWLGQHRRAQQLLVGFALETHDGEAYARQKLARKKADAIILNTLAEPGAGFGHPTNAVTLIHANGSAHRFELAPKKELAYTLLQALFAPAEEA